MKACMFVCMFAKKHLWLSWRHRHCFNFQWHPRRWHPQFDRANSLSKMMLQCEIYNASCNICSKTSCITCSTAMFQCAWHSEKLLQCNRPIPTEFSFEAMLSKRECRRCRYFYHVELVAWRRSDDDNLERVCKRSVRGECDPTTTQKHSVFVLCFGRQYTSFPATRRAW